MSTTGIAAFDSTIQITNTWLHDICEELGWKDRQRAYHALSVVLHTLRDRLPVSEVAGLSAQLPLLVRGIFYEGWHPTDKPNRIRSLEDFLAPVRDAFRRHTPSQPDQIAQAVFRTMSRHLTPGEIADIKGVLSEEIRRLWD
jgi:uncharacterized protein (DUF2267 family)